VSQRDDCLVSDILVPKIRNEDKDLGRDSVDWCEPVPSESDQAEDFESILLESADLREGTREP